ncbi:hypothetical protein S83_022845 [Arachis hypogaea]
MLLSSRLCHPNFTATIEQIHRTYQDSNSTATFTVPSPLQNPNQTFQLLNSRFDHNYTNNFMPIKAPSHSFRLLLPQPTIFMGTRDTPDYYCVFDGWVPRI